MRKITLLLTLCLMCVGMYAQTNSYTRLSAFEAARTNSKVYALKTTRSPLYFNTTNNELAGYWTSSSQAMQGSVTDVTSTAQQFALLRTNNTAANKYYMWSVEGQCFITTAGAKSVDPVANVWFADVTDKDDASHQGMKLYIGETGDNVVNLTWWSNNAAGGIRYNTNGEADAGNVFELIALDADVDLSAAMAKINELEGNIGGGEVVTPADYSVNFSTDATSSTRRFTSITLNSPKYGEQSVSPNGNYVYSDKTSEIFRIEAGEEVTITAAPICSWMFGYVYIDTDNNGFTAGVDPDTHFPTGDMVSYSFYGSETNEDSGYNSKGQSISGSGRADILNPPAFTAPTTPGTYRMRFKVDWNSIDPAGDNNSNFGGTIVQTGGTIVDVMVEIVEVSTDLDESTMNTLIANAEAALALDGVGYPVDTERATLQEAVDAAKADKTSRDLYNTLNAARTAYIATSNVKLPEDGKAYTFVSKQKNGSLYYLTYTGTTVQYSSQASAATPFICKLLENGKYVFVNNAGKYMVWRGNSAGTNGVKGYVDAYDTSSEAWCDIELTKVQEGDKVDAGSEEKLFGCVFMKGRRQDSSADRDQFAYTVIKADGNYDQASVPFFNSNFSSALMIQEATYANTPELKTADGIDGVEGLATFSAPFATVVPEGVTAWYVQGDAQSSTTCMTMTEVEGAIPANTGVILTGATGEVTMVPAAAEEVATVTNNWLKHSAGADLDIPASETAFILSKANGVVGFYLLNDSARTLGMNKSYLSNEALNSSSAVVKMNFDGETTAIETVEKVGNVNAPIYDLSGRRVVNAVKGGLYIQNGKKFIVK